MGQCGSYAQSSARFETLRGDSLYNVWYLQNVVSGMAQMQVSWQLFPRLAVLLAPGTILILTGISPRVSSSVARAAREIDHLDIVFSLCQQVPSSLEVHHPETQHVSEEIYWGPRVEFLGMLVDGQEAQKIWNAPPVCVCEFEDMFVPKVLKALLRGYVCS